MAKIVDVSITDQTRAVTQKGFKSVLLFSINSNMEFKKITDSANLTGDVKTLADKFFENGGTELNIAGTSSGIAESLDLLSGKDFYGIISDAKDAEKIKEITAWAGSNKKIYVGEIVTDTAKTAVDLAKEMNSERCTLYAVKGTDMTGLSGAVAGACFVKDAGSITWTNQVVKGVPVSGFNLTEEAELRAGNVNLVSDILGIICTYGGNTTSGAKTDITRSKDWLEARIIEAVTRLLIVVDKIPYTNKGIMQIKSVLETVAKQSISMGMLESYDVVSEPIEDIPVNDKANRILKGIKLISTLSGAIETVGMNLIIKL